MADRVEGNDSYVDYCSLAVDGEGIPHIAYHAVYYAPFPFHELRYTYRNSGGWSAPQIVDWGALYWWAGQGVSLALDHTGAARVAYLAGYRIDAEVRYARQGTDGWAIRRVEFTRYAEPSPSLALDRFESPTILYYDQESQELQCARWERNDWGVAVVEPRGGYVGQYSALVLDAEGNAHIAYTGSAGESVRYAHWNAGGWQITTITRGIVWGISLALDSAGSPHLCFCGPGGLRYAHRPAGDWLVTTVSTTPCRGVSLALDGAGKPHISTLESVGDYESYILSYTHWNGQAWLRTVVSPLDTESASLALDGAGNPHIAYLDRDSEMLRYADRGRSGWTSQGVDHADPWGVVSLALDGTGTPHIAYDAGGSDGEVRYAHGDGGAWITATIAVTA